MRAIRILLALFLMLPAAALAADPTKTADPARMPVVATFSILGDLVRQVGIDRVAVTELVGPDADAHAFQPRAADAKAVAAARLVVANGLDFEPWLPRILKSAAFKGRVVTVSQGITPLEAQEHHESPGHKGHKHEAHEHGEADPHAWHDLDNAARYVDAIAAALAEADAAGAAAYAANAAAYKARLADLQAWATAEFATIPRERRLVVTSHEALGYLARAFNLELLTVQGLSSESEPKAADVARLVRTIRERKAPAVFLENMASERLIRRIAQESGARVGGSLYTDALSGPGGPAADFLSLYRHNVAAIVAALR